MKGQSVIINYVLFFLLGFSIFLATINVFNLQAGIFSSDVAKINSELVNSYVSSLAIASVDGCKKCDSVNTTIIFINYTFGFLELNMSSRGLNVTAILTNNFYNSPVHKLNETYTFLGKSFSARPITLMFDKTQNKLEIR